MAAASSSPRTRSLRGWGKLGGLAAVRRTARSCEPPLNCSSRTAMSIHQARLADVVRRDPRYAYEAYEFVFLALNHTQKVLGRAPRDPAGTDPGPQAHVSGPELLAG